MSLGAKKVISDPTLNDLLNLLKYEIFINLNCHAVGTIQAINPSNQTAQVSVNYKKSYTGPTAKSDPIFVDYPILVDCPVVVLSGGAAALTMPIAQGDTCLVMFNDRAFDTWFSSGQVKELPNNRMHSFSDAIAMVGIRSLAAPISDYDTARAVLRNGDAKVAVGPSLIELSNNVTSLKVLVNGLIDVIEGLLTVPIPPGGIPAGAALSPASIAALEAYKGQVGGLLE